MKNFYKNNLFVVNMVVVLMCLLPMMASAQLIRMKTTLGNIDVELNPQAAPNTVTNFLNYLNRGDYDDSIIHRSAKNLVTDANFIIQGGGFHQREGELLPIPTDDPINNEFNLLNTRGTIAMAKVNNQPNSATSQWFINSTDNVSLDDPDNSGGFTVFGNVVAGMDVVDLIGSIRTWNRGGALAEVPLVGFPGGEELINDFVVKILSAQVIQPGFKINAGHNGAWFNQNTSGQGILFEILPESNLAFMAWFTYDTVAPPQNASAIVGAPEHRWLTGIGSIDQANNSITFDLFLTTGGLFDNPTAVTNSAAESYGTLTATINNCSTMDISYNLLAQQLSGTFSMIRIADDNVALCESLADLQ